MSAGESFIYEVRLVGRGAGHGTPEYFWNKARALSRARKLSRQTPPCGYPWVQVLKIAYDVRELWVLPERKVGEASK